LGVAAGFAVLSIIAVVLGRSISKIIPISLIQKIAAVTFLAIGAALVLGVV
jgi:putative Ca2+/H+ antiporter (TMEM165/GDT1 family)